MEIHWKDLEDIPDDDRRTIEGRLDALASGHSDLIDVRLAAKRNRHHQHGAQEVRITCQARGTEIVAARTRPDVGAALDEALDAFEREVRRMRDRRSDRRVERVAGAPELGIVDRVFADEGYGFILTDAGDQVYFHRNAVHGGLAFGALEEGQRVGLNIEGGEKGPQATTVVPPPPGTTGP
jgi:ribosomal subunit interface protein